MTPIKTLPFHLQYLMKYKNLTDNELNSIRNKWLTVSILLLFGMLGSFWGVLYSFLAPSMDNFFLSVRLFVGTGLAFAIIVTIVDNLELLENTKEDNIVQFNKLKNHRVASTYLKNYVLEKRSIHVLDQVLMEYLIKEESINKLMSKAKAY